MRFKSFFIIPIMLSVSLFLFSVVGSAQTPNDTPDDEPVPIPGPNDPITPTDVPVPPLPGPNDPPIDVPVPIPGPNDPITPTDVPVPPLPGPNDPPIDVPVPIPGPNDPITPTDVPIPPVPGPNDPPGDDNFPGFRSIGIQYAAPFVCGSNPNALPRVLPGRYATSVNILNPRQSPVVFRKRIALTFPPPTQVPGAVSDPIEDELGPMQALKVACDEIPSQFLPGVTDLPPYVMGFLIIESPRKLNVTAVHTTGTAGTAETAAAVQSIDVEEVKGRRVFLSSSN